jgi:hypothetical protein
MCCTFVYSVINLTWNKQYMFFIIPSFQALFQRGVMVPRSRVSAGAGQREGLHEVVAASLLPRLLDVLRQWAAETEVTHSYGRIE